MKITNLILRFAVATFVFASAAVVATPQNAPAASTEKLRIMTFNVPKGNIPAQGLNTWPNRAKAIAEFLNEAQPDLLGMQEPVVSELTDIFRKTPGYTTLGIARDDGKQGGEYSPIIYRTSRFSVDTTGTYWLSLTPSKVSKNWNSACRRIATWAVFRDKVTGARFLYTNTHLDHVSVEARKNQMKVIKEQMQKILAVVGQIPAFITGDFNCTPETEPITEAKEYLTPMNDAYEIAAKKHGVTYTFCNRPIKIDYIIITKQIKVSDAYVHNSVYESGQQLSDHNAHYADISWDIPLPERADALVKDAQAALDSLLAFKLNPAKLITSSSQLSSDGLQGGNYANLIDNYSTTYVSSVYSGALPGEGTHYISANIGKAVKAFTLYLARSPLGSADNWPTDVRIEASNDGINWNYITDLNSITFSKGGRYTSPVIVMPAEYSRIKMSVLRTEAMNIVVSSPRFTLSDLQIYEDTLNEALSQSYYDKTVGAAADDLRKQISVVKNSSSEESVAGLAEAIAAVREARIPVEEYTAKLDEAKNLTVVHTIGDDFGECSQVALDNFKKGIDKVETGTSPTGTKAEYEKAISDINALIETFKDAINYFPEGKWFYVVNHERIKVGTTRNRVLHADSIAPSAPLAATVKDEKGNRLSGGANPLAMWRFVKAEGGKHLFALQNRGTGYYLGLPDEEGHFVSSLEPVAFEPVFTGKGEFSLKSADGSAEFLTASTDNALYSSAGGEQSAASWLLTEVDAGLAALEVPVVANSISIICLPFKIEGLSKLNPCMTAYTVSGKPQLMPTVYFAKKDTFAAGEPFVLLTSSVDSLTSDGGEATLYVAPTDDVTNEALTVNGMTGTLVPEQKSAVYEFIDNELRNRNSTITYDAQKGYIELDDVKNLSLPHDLKARINGSVINGIIPVSRSRDEVQSVYTIDGVKLPAGTKLAKGIYIIDGKKKSVR